MRASEADNYPKVPNLTCLIIYNVFLISWAQAWKQLFFCCGHSPAQVLEINTIDGSLVSYLCQYFWFTLVGFSSLQGSDWMDFRKFILEESSYSYVWSLLILLDGTPHWANQSYLLWPWSEINFPLKLLKLHQKNELNFTRKKYNLPIIRKAYLSVMGRIYMANTDCGHKGLPMLGTIKSYYRLSA